MVVVEVKILGRKVPPIEKVNMTEVPIWRMNFWVTLVMQELNQIFSRTNGVYVGLYGSLLPQKVSRVDGSKLVLA